MATLNELRKAEEQAALDAKFANVTVEREGDRMVLPEGMSFDRAIEWLQRRKQEDEMKVAVSAVIDSFPLDAAHALMLALQARYGWTTLAPTPGFFGDKPPAMVSIEVGGGQTVQVPWGRIQIPGIEGYLATGFASRENRLVFALGGEVKKKHAGVVTDLIASVNAILRTKSIYKGRAIRVSFDSDDDESLPFDPQNHAPRFLDVSDVRQEELIFSEQLAELVQVNLFTPLEKTAWCREYRVPLKRGVLFEGPYGTGKTLTAYVTAKKATDNGWTFIYVDTVRSLRHAIHFAKQYQPAVIFAEDVDRVTEGEDRNDEIDGILNTLDGVDSKSSEVMVVLTTNHVERINKAMMRPGRLDAVLSIRPPDADAVTRLLRLYGRGLIESTESLEDVGRLLAGHIPAVLREVVERSKLAAITRLGTRDEVFRLTAADLTVAAKSMLAQAELTSPKRKAKDDVLDRFATKLGGAFVAGLNEVKQANGSEAKR